MRCVNCGYDNLPGIKFCGQCGTRLGKICAACGFVNPPEHRFCGECGARLPVPATEAPPLDAPSAAPVPAAPPPVKDDIPEVSQPLLLSGERRVATVVVADVTGSTDLLQHIGTERWVAVMNRVLRLLESEIYRLGGQVDQFRGDGLVAFFGAAAAHEDDPERAILAALAMQASLDRHIAQLETDEGYALRLRVGVNTGEIVVTSVGDRRQHSEDTAMGEAVTIAARMEAAAEPGTVLASENTYRLVEPYFEWLPLGQMRVKGVRDPLSVYRPLAHRVDPERPQRLQAFGLSSALVGREAEFRILQGAVEDLYGGRGGIALVAGEEGIGKSFLVAGVRRHFARHGALLAEAHEGSALPPAALTWLRGWCRSFDQAWPYSMWLSLLRNWLGMHRGEPTEEARDRLRRQAEILWGDQSAEHYPYLAAFLSLPVEPPEAERLQHLSAEGWRQQVFFTMRQWIEAMSRRGPLVLAFGDMHWADSASLDLLRYCLPVCDHEALLWLLVFRPERDSPVWAFHHHLETEYPHRLTAVTLPPLTEGQSLEFLEQLVGGEALAPATQELIVDKAEGNPYYLGELVRALMAQGALVKDEVTGGWRITRPVTSLDLPDSLQTLLLARIDRLSPEQRYVLQMAAVIGTVFWSSVLQELAQDAATPAAGLMEGPRLIEHLTALQRAQLIYERGRIPELGREYEFTSNLIRDAAYDSLLTSQQRALHARIAHYLQRTFQDEREAQYYGLLAYHFKQAGALSEELDYRRRAAEQARRVYANAEAEEHYTRALDLLDELVEQGSEQEPRSGFLAERFTILNGRRQVRYLLGQWDDARSDARALLNLAHQLGDESVWLIDALLQQPGVAHWRTREELVAGFPLAEQALSLAQQMGDRHREMQSLLAIANQRLWFNDPTGWEIAERALDLARQLGDRSFEVDILIGMGRVYEWSDQPERGMAYLEAALPLCRSLGDKMAEIDLLYLIGLKYERQGDYCRLLEAYQQKRLALSREIGHRPAEANALMQCGQIQGLYLGDDETGLRLLEESREIWENMPNELFVWLRIAQIQIRRGELGEAQRALERAWHIAHVQAIADMGQVALRLAAASLCIARAQAGTVGAEADLLQSIELASLARQMVTKTPLTQQYEMVACCQLAVAHLALAEAVGDEAAREGHVEQALECSQTALRVYERFGFVQVIESVSEEILYRHGLALAAAGRQAEARALLERADAEMMRKWALMPVDSPFRQTYLENIPLHRKIRAAVQDGASLEQRAKGDPGIA
jgi:class 3 adenylate cyclase/tetratricopeptide (TPR) repeat protein